MQDHANRSRNKSAPIANPVPPHFAAEMLGVVTEIMTVGNVDRVLQKISSAVSDLFAMRAMVMGVLDEGERVFRVRATHGYDADRDRRIRKFVYTAERLKMDLDERYRVAEDVYLIRPNPGELLKGEEPFYNDIDAAKRPRGAPSIWHELDYFRFIFRSRDGIPIGFLEVNESNNDRIPDASTIEAMRVFAELAAVAVENATLYQKQVEIAERSRFLGDTIAHDINNFNQAVTSYLHMALDPKTNADRRRMYLERATSSAWGISELIQRSNKLIKIEEEGARNLGPVELGEVLRESVERVSRTYPERNVKFDLKIGSHRYFVTGNELANEIFRNILDNAVKYDPHQKVSVEIGVGEFTIEPRKYWCVSIADNGIGIPDSKKAVVFGKFSVGDERLPGTGLGLSIVRAIVQAYHGLVWVEDRVLGDPSKGSVFRVALPISSAK